MATIFPCVHFFFLSPYYKLLIHLSMNSQESFKAQKEKGHIIHFISFVQELHLCLEVLVSNFFTLLPISCDMHNIPISPLLKVSKERKGFSVCWMWSLLYSVVIFVQYKRFLDKPIFAEWTESALGKI